MHSKEKTISSFLSFHIVSSSVSVFYSPPPKKKIVPILCQVNCHFSPPKNATRSPWQRPKRALMISSFVCRSMSQRWTSMSTDLGAWKDVSFEYSAPVNSSAQLISFFFSFISTWISFGGRRHSADSRFRWIFTSKKMEIWCLRVDTKEVQVYKMKIENGRRLHLLR